MEMKTKNSERKKKLESFQNCTEYSANHFYDCDVLFDVLKTVITKLIYKPMSNKINATENY